MLSRLTIITMCIIAVAFLVGCGSSDDIVRTALLDSQDSGNVADPGDDNGDNGGEEDSIPTPHQPEPITTLLLGGGLVAFAFLKR